MFFSALFDPLSILVVVAIVLMVLLSVLWHTAGRQQYHALEGGLKMLRRVGLDLSPEHPIRKRLESAPVVDLSFEEIAKLMTGQTVEGAARGLIRLREKLSWIERFSQYSIHLGILGTVFALVSSDPTNLESFRARLPLALGTTFWGLIGALILSTIAGAAETVLERANLVVRHALLDSLEDISDPKSTRDPHAAVLDAPGTDLGYPEGDQNVLAVAVEESASVTETTFSATTGAGPPDGQAGPDGAMPPNSDANDPFDDHATQLDIPPEHEEV